MYKLLLVSLDCRVPPRITPSIQASRCPSILDPNNGHVGACLYSVIPVVSSSGWVPPRTTVSTPDMFSLVWLSIN